MCYQEVPSQKGAALKRKGSGFCLGSVKVLVAQSCPTLCSPMDCSPPGSWAHGFCRWHYWSGLPFPSPGIFSTRRLNQVSSTAGGLFMVWATRAALWRQLNMLSILNPEVWIFMPVAVKVTWVLPHMGRHSQHGFFRVLRKEAKKQLYHHSWPIKQITKSAWKKVIEQGAPIKSHKTLKATEQVQSPHPRYRPCTPATSKRHSKCQRSQRSKGNCEDKRCHSL